MGDRAEVPPPQALPGVPRKALLCFLLYFRRFSSQHQSLCVVSQVLRSKNEAVTRRGLISPGVFALFP